MRMTAPVMTPPGLLSLQHPVWMCAMRPFFLLTMGSAVLLIALWSAVLALGLPPPSVAGGALVWHPHNPSGRTRHSTGPMRQHSSPNAATQHSPARPSRAEAASGTKATPARSKARPR